MTITADQDKTLLDNATDGPWEAYDPGDGTARMYAGEGDNARPLIHDVDDTHGCAARVYVERPDGLLIAAAPDLARTVAGMTYQWGVAHRGTVLCLDFYGTEDEEPGHKRWTESRSHAEKWKAYMEGVFPGETYRLVRRPVGAYEEVDQ